MCKHQIAYKNVDTEKELSFTVIRANDILEALTIFFNSNKNAIIYNVLRCGKPE